MNRQQVNNSYSGSRRTSPHERAGPPMHRVADVLQRESVTVRTLAKRLNMTHGQATALIDPSNDLNLSDLYRLQDVLRVPIGELLSEVDTGLSEPIKIRAQLLRLMRTVHSIEENATQKPVMRLARQLSEQLLAIMPELAGVSSWPSVGNRRTLDELGIIADRCVPSHLLQASTGESVE